MRCLYIIVCVYIAFAESVSGQVEVSTPPIVNFTLLRQYDAIHIEEPQNTYQNLKKLSLGSNTTLSFGGSYRFQTEAFIHEQFEKKSEQNDFWFLNRAMLHAHLKIGNTFELFSELNSSLITSKEAIVPVDKDELSVNQLFARYQFHKNWNLLIGRQNMRLGSGRLIDIREGPNVRLSFDMVQLQFKNKTTGITGFYAVPVQQKAGVFDNDFLETNETLSALYWTQNWTQTTNTDVYILYKEEAQKTWNLGTADDNRISLGMRHFGTWKGFNYNNEFVYQLGTFGDQNITAWTISFNVEKEFTIGEKPITLGIKTEAISGDSDASDATLQTFDALYPRGAYFGRVARFGPSNLIDIHPYANLTLGKLTLEADYVTFWRFATNDGIYNPALILDYPSENNQRFIGHQFGTIANLEVSPFISVELESNIILPSSFLQESNLDATLYHFVFTTEIRF
ncbi:alginate export family protein [uncultured Kordia sp.]|uniref:alginate export family protein n=1 Tax=uncultured Kordia sp. TaxID=507699 RepID=UPI00261F5972|nr:alginate export family protein [uncultured Kordia sp.]